MPLNTTFKGRSEPQDKPWKRKTETNMKKANNHFRKKKKITSKAQALKRTEVKDWMAPQEPGKAEGIRASVLPRKGVRRCEVTHAPQTN